MPLTYADLCERLQKLDEITLMELLEINSEDLVDRFHDKIESKRDFFEADLEDEIYDDIN